MPATSRRVGLPQLPHAVRSLTTLDDVHYADLFTLTTTQPGMSSSPEAWVRAVLEQTPLARRSARRLWRLLGLRLGPRNSTEHVQGWTIVGRGGNWIRLQTSSWYMTAQAVCLVEQQSVSISLFLRYEQPVARLVWSTVSAPHQRAVPAMLRQAHDLMGDAA